MMKIFWQICRGFLILIASIALCSCDSDTKIKDLKTYVEQLKATSLKSKDIEPTNIVNLPKPVVFKVKSTRSPFDTTSKPVAARNNNPLELYPLSSLRFKGTITVNGVIHAYIVTPENKIYQVKIGDVIGDHYGRISQIYGNRVEVEESLSEGPQAVMHTITLQLKGE